MDIYIIPDTQVKPGVDITYLEAIAKHIAFEKPKTIIMMGDWFDMPSLSSYDKGKKSCENQHYLEDIQAGQDAMDYFFSEVKKHWKAYKKKAAWIMLKGNHEYRIKRAWEYGDANMRYLTTHFKPDYKEWSKVVPFMDIYKAAGVCFSHYFANDNNGRPVGSARLILNKKHRSCVAGHQQGFDYCEQLTADKKIIHGVIAGSCYLHDEEYKTPQANTHFRGTLILRNVRDGMFDINRYSLKPLMEKYL